MVGNSQFSIDLQVDKIYTHDQLIKHLFDMELTPKQSELFRSIEAYYAEHRRPPTIHELKYAMGKASTSTIHFHLTALKAKGLVDWTPAAKRTIHLLQKTEQKHS